MRVLFVGLGAMGTPMSRHLADAGHDLVLCDLRAEQAERLAGEYGARSVPLAGVAGVAGAVDAVILMLPDSPAVEAVLTGGDRGGLFAGLAAGSLVIDMSSASPTSTVGLAARAAERGLSMLDAPVSGGVARAQTGELSIMVGGEPGAVDRARPLLGTLGSITHVGPAGAGHAMKALNNLLSAIGLVAASEVLAVGTRFGLQPQVMLDVLNSSTGGNHATRVKMARYVLSRSFDAGFSLQLMVKDLRTALDLAQETGTPTPVSAACLQEWTAARRTLRADADHTHIAAYVEARSGIEFHAPPADTPTGAPSSDREASR
jgi:3-hydroxyisobutyrate dehydrogenase